MQSEKEEAKETIKKLFNLADSVFSENPPRADKYVAQARKIAMKLRIRIPKDLKRRFCKHCYSFFMPGKNLRVRKKKGEVVYSCLICKESMRFPVK